MLKTLLEKRNNIKISILYPISSKKLTDKIALMLLLYIFETLKNMLEKSITTRDI